MTSLYWIRAQGPTASSHVSWLCCVCPRCERRETIWWNMNAASVVIEYSISNITFQFCFILALLYGTLVLSHQYSIYISYTWQHETPWHEQQCNWPHFLKILPVLQCNLWDAPLCCEWINILWANDTICHHTSWQILGKLIACSMIPRHYLH